MVRLVPVLKAPVRLATPVEALPEAKLLPLLTAPLPAAAPAEPPLLELPPPPPLFRTEPVLPPVVEPPVVEPPVVLPPVVEPPVVWALAFEAAIPVARKALRTQDSKGAGRFRMDHPVSETWTHASA